jgi:hypothetical protein
MKKLILVVILMIPMVATLAHAEVPHIFKSGDLVSSVKMNENFAAVDKQVTVRSKGSAKSLTNSAASEILSVTCNADETLISATCSSFHMDFNSSTTNFGVVWACDIVGNTAMGMANGGLMTYSSYKYGPPFTVYAVCAGPAASTSAKAMTQAEPQPAELSPEAEETRQKLESMRMMMK